MSNKAGGKDLPNMARIAPDRRWFGNTRTISQTDLDHFREEMTLKEADPYSIILRRQKIPMALLKDSEKVAKMNLLETETYTDVFGGKTKRKRPKLSHTILSTNNNNSSNNTNNSSSNSSSNDMNEYSSILQHASG